MGCPARRIATLEGHTDAVTSLSFAVSDGNILASASRDGTINLWDVGTRTLTGALHAGEVGSLSLSPDGALLASASGGDKAVKLWDVGTGELIGALEGHRYGVTAVSFSPDGTTIASGSWDRTALLWDVETRERIATLEGHGSSVTSVSFSFPAGSLLASGSQDGTVILWDVVTREKSAAFGHTDGVQSVSFSPVGATLAAGGGDGKVPMWDVSEWMRPRPWGLEIISGDGQQGVPGAALSEPLVVVVRDQYGDLLRDAEVTFTVTGGEGQLSRRFTVEHVRTDASGRAEVALTLGPHRGANTVGVSLGGRDLATFTADGLVTSVAELEGDYRTWQLPVGVRARLGKGAIGDGDRAVALSADGECLAVASATGVWLYEARTSRAQALLPSRSRVHSVAFSLDGTLAAGLDNGQVELWAVETGERIATLRHGDWGSVTVVYSRDGTVLASGSTEQVIRLWDVETRRQIGIWEAALENRSYFDISVAFSPDGTRLVSGFHDGTVRLWDVSTQTEVAILEGHTDRVTSVSFSPDGTTIASGSRDRTVILWDVETRDSIATLEGHGSAVTSVSFPSHGGGTLASGSSDHTIRLWDLATGESIGAMEEHAGTVYSVTWSRDGRTLASGSADGRVLLRDLASRNAAGLSGHAGLSSMALSPDGAILASGHPDGTVQLWDAGSRVPIGTLEGHTGGRMSLSFSLEGDLLAEAGGWQDRTIALWDVQTRRRVGRLEGHGDPVASMSFSPDAGATLASGSWDGTIKLWDVGTQTEVAHLEGHTGQVRALSFSPDGALLASASREDKGIKLWDVRTREWIGTLEGHEHEVRAVAFSPDGTTIASGSGDGTVILWDVAARESMETLEGHRSGVNAVSFADPSLLASGSSDGTVNLWDLGTRAATTLGRHAGGVHSVALAPNRVTMVSGASDGTVLLWDVSDWIRPRPFSVEIISGDGQQGVPGAALAQPLVVEVRDQYGDLLPGASVTFRVTAGEGKLSDRYEVEHTTTDPSGRASMTLSLGPHSSLNTVGVSLKGRELATFTAEGVITSVAELEGDYRSWHLPQGATRRLGKGSMAEDDRAVALSADGRCVALASGVGVWLYEVATSRPLALLRSAGPVQAVAFSLHGVLAAGLTTGEIELWDVETGERTGLLRHVDWGWVTSVAFSTDGVTLASSAGDEVNLWDVASGQRLASLEGHTSTVSSVAFSPDGTYLVSGSSDGEIKLWAVATGEEVVTLESSHPMTSLVFSPDGTTVASSGHSRTVRLWDVATQTQTASLVAPAYAALSVSFSAPDGDILAVGYEDGTVTLWDVATQEELATLEEHDGAVHSVSFSADGATLVSGARGGEVRLRDMETGNVAVLTGFKSLSAMALSPNGALLASGSQDGSVVLRDLRTRVETPLGGQRPGISALAISSDGEALAMATFTDLRLWDPTAQRQIATLEGHRRVVSDEWGSSTFHAHTPSLSFSPDGTILASGASDSTVILWDLAARERLATLEGHGHRVAEVSFHPDGTLLASASWDETVILWDVATRERMATLEGHSSWVDAVAFSPDGSTLASGSWDRTIRLWDVARRTHVATLENCGRCYSVAFSPDGTHLVSGSSDLITLWDVAASKAVATLEGHNGPVHSVAFSTDGSTVASGSRDGTMLLWDLQQLKLPRPHRLTIVRRNAQQGPAGEALAEPFVVLVRDQNGADLAGVTVTFSVTAGGGTLSAEATTTDAHGRAASTLTLGSQPGPNRVEVTVAGLEPVTFTAVGLAVPRTVEKISGDEQQGSAGDALDESFVVEVRDQNGNTMAGARVTFAATTGGGTLSVTRSTTNAQGRAATTLTLGRTPGANIVEVTVAGLEPVTFTATAKATPDFDGDGLTGFEDFFLFSEAFGGTDPRFDLDGSGTVDFADFFLFAEAFEQPARAKLLALARERIGLPEGPQLQQNAPNPFNSGTVISWIQLQPGPAQLEVFALTGQRVAVLHEGARKIGFHRLNWDGRSDQGHPLASGVYVYRLVTAEGAWTRKLTLLR